MAAKTSKSMQLESLRTKHSDAMTQLERYRLLVESVQDYAIFLLDKDGVITSWNKGAQRLKGYKANEIIGKHFSVFYRQRDKDAGKPERELELAKKLGRVEDEDWRVRKDGSEFWANVVITALFDDDHNLIGFAKVTRDLTERKQHEDELRRANVALKEQQRELERLNSAKEEFISLASHQLRTPATGVKQYLGMLLEGFLGDLPPEHQDIIRRAYESNEHQLAIVNNLLKVAQVDAGRVLLLKEQVDVKKLITDVAREYADRIKARHQKLVLELDKITVSLDVNHFRMVIDNLIDNATKYTPDSGTVTVKASLRNKMLRITVQDTGVGIDAKDVPRLFTKFSRIPNILSDAVGGSGLGLYWANKVIALHGGSIEVLSEVGKGTVFTILLPIEQVGD